MEQTTTKPIGRFASWLRAQLESRELGINQAAKYIGLAQSQLSRYARGESLPAKRSNVRKLAKFFQVSEEEIWRRIEADTAQMGRFAARKSLTEELDILMDHVVHMTPEERASVVNFAAYLSSRHQVGTEDESSREEST
jgi:transcriptional regulator with XRE-family HTH domain